ncbi:MAG: FUSC family protein, partial [Bacteroidota bacterium]
GGFFATFFFDRKAGYFLFSFFVIPLLLMCFVLRGIFNPRYLVFLYPLFLTSVGAGVYFVFHWLPAHFFADKYHKQWYNFSLFLPFLLLLGFARLGELTDFISLKYKEGYVVNKALTTWSFTNWKGATDYLKQHMQDGDVVMTTLTSATDYYMGWEAGGSIQFRQKYLEPEQGYVNYQPESSNLDAHSIANLTRTFNERNRVWLLADYYFETVYTDPQARALVFKNMELHYDAVESGDVSIYSWDRNKPKSFKEQDMILVVARNRQKRSSNKLNFEMTEAFLQKDKIEARVAVQANSQGEGFFVINDKYKYMVPPNTSNEIQEFAVPLQKNSVKVGTNTLQFSTQFANEAKDPRKGFSIHKFAVY